MSDCSSRGSSELCPQQGSVLEALEDFVRRRVDLRVLQLRGEEAATAAAALGAGDPVPLALAMRLGGGGGGQSLAATPEQLPGGADETASARLELKHHFGALQEWLERQFCDLRSCVTAETTGSQSSASESEATPPSPSRRPRPGATAAAAASDGAAAVERSKSGPAAAGPGAEATHLNCEGGSRRSTTPRSENIPQLWTNSQEMISVETKDIPQLWITSQDRFSVEMKEGSGTADVAKESLLNAPKKRRFSPPPLKKVRAIRHVDMWTKMHEGEEAWKYKPGQSGTTQVAPKHVARRDLFKSVSTTIVLINAVFIGISEDLAVRAAFRGETHPSWIWDFEVFFAIVLAAEFITRVLVFGREFLNPVDRWWNVFDFILVSSSIIQCAFEAVVDLSFLRLLRLLRVLRVFRLVRQLQMLRLMLAMIGSALASVAWAFVFLLMFTFLAATFFMQLVRTYINERWQDLKQLPSPEIASWIEKARMYFDGLLVTVTTVLASISGGVDWLDVADQMGEISRAYSVVYLMFVMFMAFGLMNIVTGIIVKNTDKFHKIDAELQIQVQLQSNASFMGQMRWMLQQADTDNSGTLSAEELDSHLASEEFRAMIAGFEVSPPEARGVFNLLDLSGEGEVSIEEFVLALVRFRGTASHVDIATLLYECKRSAKRWEAYMQFIEQQFKTLQDGLQITRVDVQNLQSYVEKMSDVSID